MLPVEGSAFFVAKKVCHRFLALKIQKGMPSVIVTAIKKKIMVNDVVKMVFVWLIASPGFLLRGRKVK